MAAVHGWKRPSSNLVRLHNYRIISLDRPGIGCSDYYALQSAQQFCADVLLLADQLKLQQFGVMSLGAGGVYAISLAHMAPERVSLHLSIAGVPGNVFNETGKHSYAANCMNELAPALVKFLVRVRHAFFPDDPQQMLERMQDHLSYTDRKTVTNPRIQKILTLDQQEAMRNGHRGIAQDLAICFRKLTFSLSEVEVQAVIWQGCADKLSQRSDCEYMVARMPQASLHRVPNQGHFFFVHSMNDVFIRLRTELTGKLARAA
jgi:pimeloyl-ACP methyl ester carboxylesterase